MIAKPGYWCARNSDVQDHYLACIHGNSCQVRWVLSINKVVNVVLEKLSTTLNQIYFVQKSNLYRTLIFTYSKLAWEEGDVGDLRRWWLSARDVVNQTYGRNHRPQQKQTCRGHLQLDWKQYRKLLCHGQLTGSWRVQKHCSLFPRLVQQPNIEYKRKLIN